MTVNWYLIGNGAGFGLLASTFRPAAGETVTGIAPRATDPETGRDETTGFSQCRLDFGDGSPPGTFDGSVAHAFAEPGIYRAVCAIPDPPAASPPAPPGPDGTARDLFVVGGTLVPAPGKGVTLPKVSCTLSKQTQPVEGGLGLPDKDSLAMVWSGLTAGPGDRIVFCYNRNRFGRMHTDPAPGAGETDDRIVLDEHNRYAGVASNAKRVAVSASSAALRISVTGTNLDRTGDPRLGGAERKGDFTGQSVALCVIPALYPSAPIRVYYMDPADLMRLTLKGGSFKGILDDPEVSVSAKARRHAP